MRSTHTKEATEVRRQHKLEPIASVLGKRTSCPFQADIRAPVICSYPLASPGARECLEKRRTHVVTS